MKKFVVDRKNRIMNEDDLQFALDWHDVDLLVFNVIDEDVVRVIVFTESGYVVGRYNAKKNDLIHDFYFKDYVSAYREFQRLYKKDLSWMEQVPFVDDTEL